MKITVRVFAVIALLLTLIAGSPAHGVVRRVAVAETYGDYTQMFTQSAGQHVSGGIVNQWAWAPQSTVESQIYFGVPWVGPPPLYHERFVRDGDWVTLPGWFDNGTYYTVQTTSEWQAAADCRTNRTFLPTGGAEHYALWTLPSAAYCLYAEGSITEQLSGNSFHFIHQQVWSPPATCPTNPQPVYDMSVPAKVVPITTCISQWESYADSNATPLTTKVERTVLLARGAGMAYSTVQTKPSAWTSYMTRAWKY